MSTPRFKYLGAMSAMLGGVIWLILWIHFALTHGLTEHNREGLLFGLTWFDSDKLAVIPLLLFMLTVVSLRAWQRESTSRLGTTGYVIALVGFPLVIIGQALLYGPAPWGIYPPEVYWSNPFTQQVAAPLSFVSPSVLGLGLVLCGVDILRRKPLTHGNALPLLLGILLFTLPWPRDTPWAWLFGVGWGVLGYVLWRTARPAGFRADPSGRHGNSGENRKGTVAMTQGSWPVDGPARAGLFRLARVWTVIALSASACTPGLTPQAPLPEWCEPGVADPEHLFYAESVTYVDPSPIAWETAAPDEVGLDAARLEEAAVEAALSETIASLLVIRHGKLVFERYFNGSDVSHANDVHSLSKSILSVVTGIAISEGLLELDTPIAEVLPADLIGSNGDLAVRHLLTMAAGMRDDEAGYDWESIEEEADPSFVRVVLERPRIAAPGEVFAYDTGITQVLAAVIAESAGVSLCDYATERLFAPLGIDVDHWHVYADGYYAGGHSMFLTPREVARFGQLVLQGGAWEGQQLGPVDWLVESLEVVWDLGCRPAQQARIGYGYLWWLYELGGHPVWTAGGYGGQNLHIVPDLDLVLVLTHVTKGDPADFEVVPSLDLLRRYVIPAVNDAVRRGGTSECDPAGGDIVGVRPDGSGRTVILEAGMSIAPWSWSPDGARIALQGDRDLNSEIYTMAADGSDLQRLTRAFATDIMPAWSPDGSTIIFARGHPASSDLYQMNTDGTSATRLTDFDGYEHSPTWSPDGKAIAFIRGYGDARLFGESGSIWTMNGDGSDPQLLLDQPAGAPSWSPNGRQIAFESRGEDISRIKVIDVESGTITDLGPGSLPRWSPDGAKLAFVSDRSGNLDVFVMEADGSNVQALTTGPERDTLPSWSPDGETILYVSFGVESG